LLKNFLSAKIIPTFRQYRAKDLKLSETFEFLMLEHKGQLHLSLDLVATMYFKTGSSAFKKHLKSGALPKEFVQPIEHSFVPTRTLAHFLDTLREKAKKKIMSNKNENTIKSINDTNDTNDTSETKNIDPMGRWMLASSLMQQYGTAVIPYPKVAADFLGWKAEKTAIAKYNDGTVDKLQLVTIQNNAGRKQPIFVAVQDLADFILRNRNVAIMN
jgi:hypothetical protein